MLKKSAGILKVKVEAKAEGLQIIPEPQPQPLMRKSWISIC